MEQRTHMEITGCDTKTGKIARSLMESGKTLHILSFPVNSSPQIQKAFTQTSQELEEQIQVWKIKNHMLGVWFLHAMET